MRQLVPKRCRTRGNRPRGAGVLVRASQPLLAAGEGEEKWSVDPAAAGDQVVAAAEQRAAEAGVGDVVGRPLVLCELVVERGVESLAEAAVCDVARPLPRADADVPPGAREAGD